jgi:hypothetical protein
MNDWLPIKQPTNYVSGFLNLIKQPVCQIWSPWNLYPVFCFLSHLQWFCKIIKGQDSYVYIWCLIYKFWEKFEGAINGYLWRADHLSKESYPLWIDQETEKWPGPRRATEAYKKKWLQPCSWDKQHSTFSYSYQHTVLNKTNYILF